MADDKKIPKGRIRRSAKLGTAMGGQATKYAGTKAASLARSEEGAQEKLEARHLEKRYVSGEATVEKAVFAMKSGAFDFLQKPLQMEMLLDRIERAVLKSKLDVMTRLYEKSRSILSHLEMKEVLEPLLKNIALYFLIL